MPSPAEPPDSSERGALSDPRSDEPDPGSPAGRVPVGERIAFAAGDVFAGGASSLISVCYLFFLTNIVGLGPGLAGTAVLVAKLWDSVNDPLMGAISDRTRTRLGRRRPFLLAGSLLVMAAMAVLWLPTPPVTSQLGLMLWAMGSYIVYNTIQTMVAVPYASLSTELSPVPAERDKANVLRLLFSTVASATITLTATSLVTANRAGTLSADGLYAALVFGFGGLFTLVMLGTATIIRERVPPAPVDAFSLRTFVAPLAHPPFRLLMALYLCHAIAMDVVAASVLYYSAFVVRLSPLIFLGVFIVVNLVAFAVANHLVKRISKHLIYRTLLPLALVSIWVVALYPRSWPVLGVYLGAAGLAIGMAGAQLMPWVMLPDVLDSAEVETGRRSAGSFSGLMTFTRGIASSFAIFAIGWALQLSGYVGSAATQAPSVVIAIRVILLAAVFTLLSLSWWVSGRYPLRREVTVRNAEILAVRRASGSRPG